MKPKTQHLIAILLFIAHGPVHGQPQPAETGQSFEAKLVAAALNRVGRTLIYDGSYRRLAYPMGDVPDHMGVCTDVIIRAYRAIGIDLQQLVHRDMKAAFAQYPTIWGLRSTDRNIDHRRVPNLATFFKRGKHQLPISQNARDYRPGDLVTWMLPSNRPHIGMVVYQKTPGGKRPMIVHNIGSGTMVEDILFQYKISGHFRYVPGQETNDSSPQGQVP